MSNIEQGAESNVGDGPAEQKTKHRRASGAAVEAGLGLVAVLAAIPALAGFFVVPLTGAAVIAAGAALMFDGAAAAAEEARAHPGTERELVGGFGAASLAGMGAIALAILALAGIERMTLLPVAAIVLGSGMLLNTGTTVRAQEVPPTSTGEVPRRSPFATWSIHTLAGAGAIPLGILALLDNAPIVLTLIAVLAVGAGLALSGAAIGGRMVAMFSRGT
jgi:hypothetical protein